MNNNFPPNLNPTTYNLIAITIGIILSNELNANEQNSLGNWFTLLGQYLETNSAQLQLIESRTQNFQQNNYCNQSYQQDIDFLLNSINKIYDELNNIKNNQ